MTASNTFRDNGIELVLPTLPEYFLNPCLSTVSCSSWGMCGNCFSISALALAVSVASRLLVAARRVESVCFACLCTVSKIAKGARSPICFFFSNTIYRGRAASWVSLRQCSVLYRFPFGRKPYAFGIGVPADTEISEGISTSELSARLKCILEPWCMKWIPVTSSVNTECRLSAFDI